MSTRVMFDGREEDTTDRLVTYLTTELMKEEKRAEEKRREIDEIEGYWEDITVRDRGG
jgi:hypothetical protein